MWSKSIEELNPNKALQRKCRYCVFWYIRDVKIYIMEFTTKEGMDAWVAKVCKASFDGVFLNGVRIFYEVREVE